MPLHINELGIEFSVDKQMPQSSNDDGCCDSDLAEQKAMEDRLVERATERVLATLRTLRDR